MCDKCGRAIVTRGLPSKGAAPHRAGSKEGGSSEDECAIPGRWGPFQPLSGGAQQLNSQPLRLIADPVTLGRGGRVMWERGAESFQGVLTHRRAKCDLARRSGGLAATQG